MVVLVQPESIWVKFARDLDVDFVRISGVVV